MDVNSIIFSMLFGIIGLGYFAYGKKNNVYFLVVGIVLLVFPCAVETLTALITIGVALLALPFLLTHFLPL